MDDILNQLELAGTERAEALDRIHAIVKSWGLRLPAVPACPLHFGLGDFYRVGETEFDINKQCRAGVLRQADLHVQRPSLPVAPSPYQARDFLSDQRESRVQDARSNRHSRARGPQDRSPAIETRVYCFGR